MKKLNTTFAETLSHPYINESLLKKIKELVKKDVLTRTLLARMYEDVSIVKDSSIIKLKLKADETKDGKEHEISNILYFDGRFSG